MPLDQAPCGAHFILMFQTYDDTADPTLGAARVARLRSLLKEEGYAGFLIPRADEHQGEYVPPRAERLKWLTGFSGSAGLAAVLLDSAAIFVDGRYTLQVRTQVDTDVFQTCHLIDMPPQVWLAKHLKGGGKLAYDPWLHTVDSVKRLKTALVETGAELVALPENLIDRIWEDQPEPPAAPVTPHEEAYAGEEAQAKLERISATLKERKVDAAVLTMPDSIAWLFNIRGHDVSHTPLPLSFAIVKKDGTADLFIDERKLGPETRNHLGNIVAVHAPDAFGVNLGELGENGAKVQIDPASCADWINAKLLASGANVTHGADPCELPKACKNAREVDGARKAHERDGAALVRFLAWLDENAPSGKVTEIEAAKQLEAFRAESGLLKDISFDTISGAGPNGAIVHYRVTEKTDRALGPGELYLVDSGAQYLDGTTDVTRTIAIGKPSAEMKDRFTRVLKGHIALSMARYPEGTTGAQLDALARMALWQAGLDFDHGTGHGVGSYLSVHEGPQRISKAGHEPLRPGMIVSNEPGYYKTDAYGIRIENLQVVTAAAMIDGGERPMLGFETLTLAPIDRRLIDASLLTADEKAWLNAYHARVAKVVGAQVDEKTSAWLAEATRAV